MSKEKENESEQSQVREAVAAEQPKAKSLKPNGFVELAFGVVYHGIAHPLTALSLFTTEKNIDRCRRMLQGIEGAYQAYTAIRDAQAAQGEPTPTNGDEGQQGVSQAAVAPYRNDKGEVVIRGFRPEPPTVAKTASEDPEDESSESELSEGENADAQSASGDDSGCCGCGGCFEGDEGDATIVRVGGSDDEKS